MTIIYISLSQQVFLFHGHNISEIIRLVGEYVDRDILQPEDFLQFVELCKHDVSPNMVMELDSILNKRAA